MSNSLGGRAFRPAARHSQIAQKARQLHGDRDARQGSSEPNEALLFLRDVRERLTIVVLDENEYFKVLEDAASAKSLPHA